MGNLNNRTITASQYAVLQQNIRNDDRVAFYANLFKFTGSENALLMGKISSSSGVIGGIAWALNTQIQKESPDKYPPEGIAYFSRQIATNDFGLIHRDPKNPLVYNIPTEREMLDGAYFLWLNKGLGNYFPGVPMIAQDELMLGHTASAIKYMSDFRLASGSMSAALKETTGFVIDDPSNLGKSIQSCLNQNPDATTRTFTAYNRDVTEVVSKEGKSVCFFDKFHGLPGSTQDIQVNPMGDVINTTFNQTSDGKYILDTRDLYGSYRRDIYDLNGATPYLDKTDITLKAADGSIAHGIYDLNANGGVQNQQIITTTPAGKTTATFIGKDNVGTIEHADIKLAENSSSIINGEGNSITPMGDGVWAHFNGSDLQVNATKPMTIGFSGHRESFSGVGSTVWLNAGTEGDIHGGGNSVVLNGSGNYAEIAGANANVIALAAGQRIGVSGDNQHVSANGSDVWFHDGSDGSLIGDKNTFVANGTDVQAFVYGSDSHVVSKAAGNTLTLVGERDTVSAVDNNVWFAGGSYGGVFGDKNRVVANGQNVQMAVVGSDTLAISPNVGNTITMQGERVTVSAEKNNVWFAPGTDGGIYGAMNKMIANGTDIQMYAQGNGDQFISNFEGNTYTYSGRDGYAFILKSAFWATDYSTASVYGNGNVVVSNGTYTQLRAYGDDVTYLANVSGGVFEGTGHNMTIHGDNTVIALGKNTDAVIYGRNNYLKNEDPSNHIRFVDEPWRNAAYAPTTTPTPTTSNSPPATYHPSSSPFQIGQLSLFNNFDAFNTGGSSGVLQLGDGYEGGFF